MSAMTRAAAIIAAAGESRRMAGIDKMLAPVAGKPVLAWAVEPFERAAAIQSIVLVLRADLLEQGRRLAQERRWRKVVAVTPGGARRQDSVKAGLDALPPCDWVLVHDGARPCVTEAMIGRGLEAAQATGAAIAAVPAKDTIKVVGSDHVVCETPDRSALWLVQTPQVFRYDILRDACARPSGDVTDDASLVEQAGHRVRVFMGAYENIKVTTPEDLALAELFLRGRT